MGSKSKDNEAIISKEKSVPYPHASALHRRMLELKKDAASEREYAGSCVISIPRKPSKRSMRAAGTDYPF
jgi:hypothetical protein